jgi:hypothetical protein
MMRLAQSRDAQGGLPVQRLIAAFNHYFPRSVDTRGMWARRFRDLLVVGERIPLEILPTKNPPNTAGCRSESCRKRHFTASVPVGQPARKYRATCGSPVLCGGPRIRCGFKGSTWANVVLLAGSHVSSMCKVKNHHASGHTKALKYPGSLRSLSLNSNFGRF